MLNRQNKVLPNFTPPNRSCPLFWNLKQPHKVLQSRYHAPVLIYYYSKFCHPVQNLNFQTQFEKSSFRSPIQTSDLAIIKMLCHKSSCQKVIHCVIFKTIFNIEALLASITTYSNIFRGFLFCTNHNFLSKSSRSAKYP